MGRGDYKKENRKAAASAATSSAVTPARYPLVNISAFMHAIFDITSRGRGRGGGGNGAGRQWLVEYSVLSTRYSQPSARVLAVRERYRGRKRDKFCNKRRFDGQHIRLLMLPINAGRVIAKLP